MSPDFTPFELAWFRRPLTNYPAATLVELL